MTRAHERQHTRELSLALGALATLLAACASPDAVAKLHAYGPAEDGGSDIGGASPAVAGGGAGGSAPASAGGSPAVAGAGAGGTDAGVAGADAGGAGSHAGAGGVSGASNAGGSGAGVIAGAGGAGGATASAGSGGASEQLLSEGKPASADSEETAKGNLAALGNDGSASTRWCAGDGAGGHYWQVDLGQSHTLSKLQVSWEKAVVYQFKVEGSADTTTWSSLVDQTSSTNATPAQTYPLPTAPVARYVRITTTTLPDAKTWASFFEFQVYGH